MKNSVIAIGLDAAEPAVLEGWMADGHLNNLKRLREQGTYGRLQNFDYYRAETPWTTFLTGCTPQKTGYWSPIKFNPRTYDAELIEAYDFQEYQPFYALGDDYRVAIFDMPQTAIAPQANGIQILGWGGHSAQTPSHSSPAPLFDELVTQYGMHPGFRKDHANCLDIDAMMSLTETLKQGVALRSQVCRDFLQREPWDLFLTIFGETHAAGHTMWHLSQPNHPLYQPIGTRAPRDGMLDVFKAVDQAIGEILATASEDTNIVVFSVHGMDANVMDLPSMAFLPEFMYRFNFPGRIGVAQGEAGELKPPKTELPRNMPSKDAWRREVWSLKYESNPVMRWLRQQAPTKLDRLEKFLGWQKKADLISPHELQKRGDRLFFQPAEWYQPCWLRMKAFALPSFSEGYIRINLRGREANGIVEPADYEALCSEISDQLYRLVDARTGVPMVKRIMRTRQSPLENDPKLPDADLVVIWQEDHATDIVESPEFGRIGPLPHLRTGSHRSQGFMVAKGPGIEPNSDLPEGHSLDVTPTILKLMNAPIPDYFDGKPLIETPALVG
jgi:predicted AlkP superfamily phosphohydrolase/phosphomutase